VTQRVVLVYIDLDGTPTLAGRLWTRVSRDRESASFEYDRTWLDDPDSFALEPALPRGRGAFHTAAGRVLFGALGDSAPDRWGRTLVARASAHQARAQGRTPPTLHEIDYLLAVRDETRQGALRFAETDGGPFLESGPQNAVPPLVDLAALLSASDHVEHDDETGADLALLLAPGSSLGGARPKASVRLRDGALAIAKFPSMHDEVDAVRWERVALDLAGRAGISVPKATLHTVGRHRVLITRRFDRRGSTRLPYLSAMSMLQARDGDHHSYVEIADALRQHGATTTVDLHQLWRRLVFNMLISNSDDHLRNHGFLHAGRNGWQLSPAFDLNPVPTDIKPRSLTTTIDTDGDPSATIEQALAVASQFALSSTDADAVVAKVSAVVATWRAIAKTHGIRTRELDRMATAFELAG
jgi:serine/threonine-protein kinase HipA